MFNIILEKIKKIKNFALNHKIISIISLIIIVFINYKVFASSNQTEIRYVTTRVEKGSIISSVSGTGQIEAMTSIDLKSKISGTIVSVNALAGLEVKKGDLLFSIDNQDVRKALRDAELNLEIAKNDLENAKVDYENTKKSQELSLKNSLISLNSDVSAIPDYENTNTNIVNLLGSYNSTKQGRYTLEAYACQKIMCVKYYGLSNGEFVVDLNIPKPLSNSGLYASFSSLPRAQEKWYIDIPSPTNSSYLSNLKSYTEKEQSVKESIDSALQNLKSKEFSLIQKENSLKDTKDALSDYYIRAPFDGTVASVSGKVGDIASSTLGTIITKQKIAIITLNEIDVSHVSLGQKATLTFDALSDLSITGSVVEIDGVGTVSSGVVSYEVKISLDLDNKDIKPGMSITATVITDSAQDVLIIPNSAIKNDDKINYVAIFEKELNEPKSGVIGSLSDTSPKKTEISIGISDGTNTEIKSGLKEGDIVVTKTIKSSSSKTNTSNSSSSTKRTGTTGMFGAGMGSGMLRN